MLLLLGCTETPLRPESVGLVIEDPLADLAFTVPTLTTGQLVDDQSDGGGGAPRPIHGVGGGTEGPPGPALAEWDEEFGTDLDEVTKIMSAKTVVGFEPTYAYARGEHIYSGNKGRVEATAHVSLHDRHLATAHAVKQDDEVFLLDFGRAKWIYASARVTTDANCGLAVSGESLHMAWWEFFTGTGVSVWGRAEQSSRAGPDRQGACDAPPRGGGTATSEQVDGWACHYLLTYDLDSGAVLDTQFMYCEPVDSNEF